MTTAQDIIQLALKDIGVLGVGQTVLPEDLNDAFVKLNWMLSQWQRKRWLVYRLDDLSITSTGAQSYSIGPGGDINVSVRPDRIEAAFFRQTVQSQPNLIDYPLQLLFSREDYNNIALKGLTTFPSFLFYDSDFPLGYLYAWPVLQASIYALHVSVKKLLPQFTSLTEVVNLPPEYMAAIELNLAIRLAPGYQRAPDPAVVALARDALNVIKNSNAQIPRLLMPTDLIRPGVYNPYSDQVR